MIISARYPEETETQVAVTDENGVVATMPSFPSDTYYDTKLQTFLDGGGTIDPYDPYYGWTLEHAVKIKSNESEQYAQANIDQAYSEPTQGVIVDGATHKRRTESRRKDKSDKQAGEIVLTEDEKNEAKTDQKLSEHETKCWDASDKVLKNIDKESTVVDVMAIDVATNTNWPVWSAPTIQ